LNTLTTLKQTFLWRILHVNLILKITPFIVKIVQALRILDQFLLLFNQMYKSSCTLIHIWYTMTLMGYVMWTSIQLLTILMSLDSIYFIRWFSFLMQLRIKWLFGLFPNILLLSNLCKIQLNQIPHNKVRSRWSQLQVRLKSKITQQETSLLLSV